MKFSLFAISAVALCLLQQSQASPLGGTGELLGPVTNLVGGGNAPAQGATVDNTVGDGVVTGNAGSLAAPVDGYPAGQDPVEVSNEVKRDNLLGLGDLLGGLLNTVKELLGSANGSSGLLDINKILNLDGLVSNLVSAVRSLLGEGGLVGELLETVTELLDTVLDLLHSLGIDKIVDLSELEELVDDLIDSIGNVSKRDIAPQVAGGNLKTIDLNLVKGLLEKVESLLKEVGLEGILKPILEIVDKLLGGAVKGGAVKGAAPNTSALRRALIKRAIERRAAL